MGRIVEKWNEMSERLMADRERLQEARRVAKKSGEPCEVCHGQGRKIRHVKKAAIAVECQACYGTGVDQSCGSGS